MGVKKKVRGASGKLKCLKKKGWMPEFDRSRPLRRLPSTLGEGLEPESEAPVEGALEISASKIFDQ